MNSFVFVACLLGSFAAANPVEVERRAFGAGGVSASSQQQQSQSASASYKSSGYGGAGGIGGIGGIGGGFGGGLGGSSSSSYSAHSSSSYSSSTVMNSFSGLGSQIAAIHSMLAGGGLTQAIAMQKMSQLASSMQLALSQSVGCGCFGQGNFISSVSNVFSQFYSLMTSMQSTFGGSFGSLLQPFGSLSSTFQSFFSSFSSAGYSVNSIIPSGLPSLFNGVIPNMAHMAGFK